MASKWKLFVLAGVVIAALAIILGTLMIIPMRKEYRAYVYRAAFVCVLQTLIIIGSLHIWSHLKNLPALLGAENVVCHRLWQAIILVFIAGAQGCYFTIFFTGTEPKLWIFTTYVFLGTFIQLNICLLTITAIRFLLRIIGVLPKPRRIPTEYDENNATVNGKLRREKAISCVVAIVYAILVASFGTYQGQQPAVIRAVDIPIDGLGVEFNDLKIVQISDIHLGPTVGKSHLERIVRQVADLNPDIMVMVGDLVDGSVKQLKLAVNPLKSIQPAYGKYYVTGNHEYYTGDVDNWFYELRELGFTVLHNEHVKITHESGSYFYMAGTDDTEGGRIGYGDHGMDLDKAVSTCDEDHPIVLLAHRPAAAKKALDSQYNIQLVLSGHTHGGQIFPFMLGAYLFNPFFLGLYEYNGRYVYVSEGTAYWGIPMRILTTKEITIVTLHPKPNISVIDSPGGEVKQL